jgi:hypothetical protein
MIHLTEAEFNELKNDAERYRWIRKNYQWRRFQCQVDPDDKYGYVMVKFPYDTMFTCDALLDDNIDAGIAGKPFYEWRKKDVS